MKKEILNKALYLQSVQDHITKAIKYLEEELHISIGSSTRMDKYPDVHERLKLVVLEELNKINSEIDEQIEKL